MLRLRPPVNATPADPQRRACERRRRRPRVAQGSSGRPHRTCTRCLGQGALSGEAGHAGPGRPSPVGRGGCRGARSRIREAHSCTNGASRVPPPRPASRPAPGTAVFHRQNRYFADAAGPRRRTLQHASRQPVAQPLRWRASIVCAAAPDALQRQTRCRFAVHLAARGLGARPRAGICSPCQRARRAIAQCRCGRGSALRAAANIRQRFINDLPTIRTGCAHESAAHQDPAAF